jgi:DNA-binding transcriptional LysR family regulator
MNLRQIEVFHAVYSVGSVSGASRLLNVSQPSVSKIIKHAETRLGYCLFKLVKGRLLPTDEAHVLFREVDDLHARIDVFHRTAKNLRSTSDGQMRMGVLPSLAMSLTPAVIARYRARYPRVSFEVTAVHHDNFRDSLVSRECDFVVGHHLLHDPEIASTSLGLGRVGALFRRGLLPPDEDRVGLPALQKHEVIGFSPSVAIGGLVGPAVYAAGMGGQPSIVVRSVYIAAALARQGAGIAVVDEFTAHGFLSDELDFRLIEPAVTFELKALHLADHPLSRLARNFLDLKRSMIAERATMSPSSPYLEVIGSSLN